MKLKFILLFFILHFTFCISNAQIFNGSFEIDSLPSDSGWTKEITPGSDTTYVNFHQEAPVVGGNWSLQMYASLGGECKVYQSIPTIKTNEIWRMSGWAKCVYASGGKAWLVISFGLKDSTEIYFRWKGYYYVDTTTIWTPFSITDTLLLDKAKGESIALYAYMWSWWQGGAIDASIDSFNIEKMGIVIDLSNDTILNCGDTILLDAGDEYASYLWQDGSSGDSFLVTQSGTYWVTVVDSDGFIASDIINVLVSNFSPPIIYTNGDTIFCQGDSVVLNSDTAAGFTYQWRKDGVNIIGQIFSGYTVLESGKYSVVIDSNGCNKESNVITVTVNNNPDKPTISQNGNMLFCDTTANNYQWYDSSGAINGATNQTYTISKSGIYSVEIIDSNGCKAKSDPFNAIFTGFVDLTDNFNSIKIYPNPFSENTEIEIQHPEIICSRTELIIYDVLGQEISRQTTQKGQTTMQIKRGNMLAGIYFYKVLQNNGLISIGKFIIQ